MNNKTVILVTLVILGTYAQGTTSLTNFLKGRQTYNSQDGCAEYDEDNICMACQDGFDLQGETCIRRETEAPPEAFQGEFTSQDDPQSQFIDNGDESTPCGNRQFCGQAKNFGSEQEYQKFVEKYAPKQTPNIFFKGGGLMGGLDMAETTSFSDMRRAAPSPSPVVNPNRDFSTTNNQVTNVDQADLLKTDGTYIYTISNQVLSIVLAYPANRATVMSTVKFDNVTPQAIFIQGDYLAVFGTQYVNDYDNYSPDVFPVRPFAKMIRPYPYYQSYAYTFIKVYDISNRKSPSLLKDFQVFGSYFDGRKLQNGFMYLVTKHIFSYRRIFPWYDFGFGRINIPFRSIFWYPGTYVRPSGVNIISFNLADPLSQQRKVVTICAEQASILYMSYRNIYLATNTYQSGGDYTKLRKIYVNRQYIRPFADGRVRGTTNNQFSLDQSGRFLRIATTTNSGGPGGVSSSNVFVLNYYLKSYGQINNIAPSERIYSCRFVGTRLYMVTFRQIDPFFVISLRNPRKPQILGQLKITGFSRYLHPYDETTIIGIGRQADANGRQLGLKISVFDVSNVRRPRESAKFQLEQQYASSTAEWEHKAFLLSAEKNLMVIPGNMDYNGTRFNGAFIFNVSPNKVQLGAVVDHLIQKNNDNFYNRNVERSLYIEENLYTKSKCLIRINRLDKKFSKVKDIKLSCDQKSYFPQPGPIRFIDTPFIDRPVFRTLARQNLREVADVGEAV